MQDLKSKRPQIRSELENMFGKYPLDHVLKFLNRVCISWRDKVRPPDLEVFDQFPKDTNFPIWAAAETARYAIWFCLLPSHDSPIEMPGSPLNNKSLSLLIDRAITYQLGEPFVGTDELEDRITNEPFPDVLSRLLGPQILFQRSVGLRPGQALMLYKDAPERRSLRLGFDNIGFQQSLTEILGCSIEAFVLSAIQVGGHAFGLSPETTINNLTPLENRRLDNSQLYSPIHRDFFFPNVGFVLKLLSGNRSEIISWCNHQIKGDKDAAIFEAPNPLLRYPLIQAFSDKPDYVLAPVPHLVMEWLYEPLMNHLGESLPRSGRRKELSEVFEEYVGLIADLCSPDGIPWISEDALKQGYSEKKVIDWAKDFGSTTVLLEAKRSFISINEKYQSTPDVWQKKLSIWEGGLLQASEFWRNVKDGKVPGFKVSRDANAVAVIVTQADSDTRASLPDTHTDLSNRVAEVCEPIPFIIVSLGLFERIISTWHSKPIEWLPQILLQASREKTTQKILKEATVIEGPILDRFTTLVESLKTNLRASGEGEPQ